VYSLSRTYSSLVLLLHCDVVSLARHAFIVGLATHDGIFTRVLRRVDFKVVRGSGDVCSRFTGDPPRL
jgi:hypothetical protein